MLATIQTSLRFIRDTKSKSSALLSNFVNIHKILIINKFIFFYKNNGTQTSFKAVDIICFNFTLIKYLILFNFNCIFMV